MQPQINKTVRIVPVVSASPDYGIDDVLGTKMTITGSSKIAQGTLLQACTMVSDVDIPAGVTVDVIVFHTNPTNSTFTDNSALTVHVDDLQYVITAFSLAERFDFGTACALVARNLAINCTPTNAGTLYAVAVIRGAATLNLAAVDDIAFHFHFVQE